MERSAGGTRLGYLGNRIPPLLGSHRLRVHNSWNLAHCTRGPLRSLGGQGWRPACGGGQHQALLLTFQMRSRKKSLLQSGIANWSNVSWLRQGDGLVWAARWEVSMAMMSS